MPDAVQGLRLPAEMEERFAFEFDQIILADHRSVGHFAAAENVGDFLAHVNVILGGVTGDLEIAESNAKSGQSLGAEDADRLLAQGPPTFFEHVESDLFGVVNLAIL